MKLPGSLPLRPNFMLSDEPAYRPPRGSGGPVGAPTGPRAEQTKRAEYVHSRGWSAGNGAGPGGWGSGASLQDRARSDGLHSEIPTQPLASRALPTRPPSSAAAYASDDSPRSPSPSHRSEMRAQPPKVYPLPPKGAFQPLAVLDADAASATGRGVSATTITMPLVPIIRCKLPRRMMHYEAEGREGPLGSNSVTQDDWDARLATYEVHSVEPVPTGDEDTSSAPVLCDSPAAVGKLDTAHIRTTAAVADTAMTPGGAAFFITQPTMQCDAIRRQSSQMHSPSLADPVMPAELATLFQNEQGPLRVYLLEPTANAESASEAAVIKMTHGIRAHGGIVTKILRDATHLVLFSPPAHTPTSPCDVAIYKLFAKLVSGHRIISHDWINDCLRIGTLFDEDDHLIAPPAGISLDASGRPYQPTQAAGPRKTFPVPVVTVKVEEDEDDVVYIDASVAADAQVAGGAPARATTKHYTSKAPAIYRAGNSGALLVHSAETEAATPTANHSYAIKTLRNTTMPTSPVALGKANKRPRSTSPHRASSSTHGRNRAIRLSHKTTHRQPPTAGVPNLHRGLKLHDGINSQISRNVPAAQPSVFHPEMPSGARRYRSLTGADGLGARKGPEDAAAGGSRLGEEVVPNVDPTHESSHWRDRRAAFQREVVKRGAKESIPDGRPFMLSQEHYTVLGGDQKDHDALLLWMNQHAGIWKDWRSCWHSLNKWRLPMSGRKASYFYMKYRTRIHDDLTWLEQIKTHPNPRRNRSQAGSSDLICPGAAVVGAAVATMREDGGLLEREEYSEDEYDSLFGSYDEASSHSEQGDSEWQGSDKV